MAHRACVGNHECARVSPDAAPVAASGLRGLNVGQRRLGRPKVCYAAPRMPAASVFASKLNEQIANEFAAHQQYVACAVYYEGETLPQLAGFFYRQALE